MTRQMKSRRLLTAFFVSAALFLSVGTALSADANVFAYHRFGDARYPSTNIAIETFAEQLRILDEQDFTVLTLGQIAAHLREQRPLPERCAALTVDDGYATFLSGAVPLLEKYGYPATLFVNTGSVGAPDYLDWEELRRIAAQGIEIGSHSHSHDHLIEMRPDEDKAAWRKRVRADLQTAQELFSRHLGKAPELFAYPYGEYTPELVEIVREVGFTAAAGQQSGVVYSGSEPYLLPRFPMGGPFATVKGFRNKLAMRALPVEAAEPFDPVISADNPPLLRLRIDPQAIAVSQLRCFVDGKAEGKVTAVEGEAGVFLVQSEKPLTGRRSKYTLTAPDPSGKNWHWYSHLWIRPEVQER